MTVTPSFHFVLPGKYILSHGYTVTNFVKKTKYYLINVTVVTVVTVGRSMFCGVKLTK